MTAPLRTSESSTQRLCPDRMRPGTCPVVTKYPPSCSAPWSLRGSPSGTHWAQEGHMPCLRPHTGEEAYGPGHLNQRPHCPCPHSISTLPHPSKRAGGEASWKNQDTPSNACPVERARSGQRGTTVGGTRVDARDPEGLAQEGRGMVVGAGDGAWSQRPSRGRCRVCVSRACFLSIARWSFGYAGPVPLLFILIS